MAEQVRIWCAMQRQRRLPDADSKADRPAYEEATRAGQLSCRQLCPVNAIEEGLTATTTLQMDGSSTDAANAVLQKDR